MFDSKLKKKIKPTAIICIKVNLKRYSLKDHVQ